MSSSCFALSSTTNENTMGRNELRDHQDSLFSSSNVYAKRISWVSDSVHLVYDSRRQIIFCYPILFRNLLLNSHLKARCAQLLLSQC